MTVQTLMQRFYPAQHRNGTLDFYRPILAEAKKDWVVLNVGAGLTAEERIKCLRGKVALVIGLDIDPAVLGNEDVDFALVVDETKAWPLPDNYFDCVWADFVLEHVRRPDHVLSEVHRVLKPGASFHFRTPNRRHYVAGIARCMPHWMHEVLANRVRNLPAAAHAPYPTTYLLNTLRDLRAASMRAGFERQEFRMVEPNPSYLNFHVLPFLVGVAWEKLVNRFDALAGFRANIMGRFVKSLDGNRIAGASAPHGQARPWSSADPATATRIQQRV